MNVARMTFNPFQENTYVVWDDTNECIIIDAGMMSRREEESLANFIEERGLKPVMAVNTHGHVDHILGVQGVKERYGIPFAVSSEDKFLIDTAVTHGAMYGFQGVRIPEIDIDLKDLSELRFGDTVLKIIRTPGHTPGHVALYNETEKTLFTGDTLFKESIGRTDLPGGDYGWIMRSIIERLLPLGGEVRFYPGHGSDSTLGHEMNYNPFVTEVIDGDVNAR